MNIFVTGGTEGIGLALAQQFLQDGHRVGICGRNLEKLPEISDDWGYFYPYRADVTKRDELKRALDQFLLEVGSLDIMVANAGIASESKDIDDLFPTAYSVINVNITGLMHALDLSLPIFKHKKLGHFVAIGSVAGLIGIPGASVYCGSKAFVMKLCESLAVDLEPYNVDVTAIAPGFIDSAITRKNKHSMPFFLPTQEGARRIKEAIYGKKVLYVFPLRMRILITILERMPRWAYRYLMKNIVPMIRGR